VIDDRALDQIISPPIVPAVRSINPHTLRAIAKPDAPGEAVEEEAAVDRVVLVSALNFSRHRQIKFVPA